MCDNCVVLLIHIYYTDIWNYLSILVLLYNICDKRSGGNSSQILYNSTTCLLYIKVNN